MIPRFTMCVLLCVQPERVGRLIHLARVIHPFSTFTHSHTHVRTRRHVHANTTTTTTTTMQKVACVDVRITLLFAAAPSSSHSNRIVFIINEAALGFSGEPRFRVTGFRVSVRPCVYRTCGCVRDAPYLFTHAVEYNCDSDVQREVFSRRETCTYICSHLANIHIYIYTSHDRGIKS